MEFVKITFPTKEDIASTVYDSVAVAVEAIPGLQSESLSSISFTEQACALYEMGQEVVSSISQRPLHLRKVSLEEWSSEAPNSEEP